MLKKPVLVITDIHDWSYFQWFLLGFYRLQSSSKIQVRIHSHSVLEWILNHSPNYLLSHVAFHFLWRSRRNKTILGNYYCDGFLELPDGRRKTFTIDHADTPYMYDLNRLRTKDVYFKMQYPICIEDEAFHLTDTIDIPWIDSENIDSKYRKKQTLSARKTIKNFHQYLPKIKPLMVGPRRLSFGNSSALLEKGFKNYRKEFRQEKTKIGMCYFGNAKGPKPSEHLQYPDFGWEADLEGWFKEKICHPNFKRAVISDYLYNMGGYDARIISRENSDTGKGKNTQSIIPLDKFCQFISKFKYNFNVSGYGMSIPNRFIESFMVGTGIITDKLHCRWYQPFDDEVKETVPMGYLPMDKVNWDQFKRDVEILKDSHPEKINEAFRTKWAPEIVAEYIIKTIAEA